MTPNWASSRFPVVAVSRVAEIQLGKMLQPARATVTDELTPYLRAGSLSRLDTDDYPEMFASRSDRKKYGAVEGDLLVAEGGDVGRAEFAGALPTGTIIQNSLHRLRSRTNDIRFVKYALDAVHASGWLEVYCSKSTFGHLTREKLAALTIPVPPPSAQRAVADYLDAETERIDAVISCRQRQTSVLAERLISEVERRVLGMFGDSQRETEPSAFFQNRPRGWQETALRHAGIEVQTGPFGTQLHAADYVDGGTPVINPMHVVEGAVVPSPDMAVDEPKRHELARHLLAIDDIVVARRGELGRIALVDRRSAGYLCGTGSIRLRPRRSVLRPGYLSMLLSSQPLRAYFETASVGSTMDNLSAETLLAAPVLIPPWTEQTDIEAAVLLAKHRAQERSRLLSRQINLLLERRLALITLAVMGMLQIPEAAV
jgi:type I restriction enzyme S subunit